jgi:hypothetical protein
MNDPTANVANGNLDQITIEHVTQAASQNDALAFRVLDEAISHKGVAS